MSEAGPVEIDALELHRLLAEGRAVLIDVREPEEFEDEHIPGATLMPLSAFEPRALASAIASRPVVLNCLSGTRSAKAAAALAAAGHNTVMTLKDGLLGWKAAGFRTAGAADKTG